jgi:hypothetical protein
VLHHIAPEARYIRAKARKYLIRCALLVVALGAGGAYLFLRGSSYWLGCVLFMVFFASGAAVTHLRDYRRNLGDEAQVPHTQELLLTERELRFVRPGTGGRCFPFGEIDRVFLLPRGRWPQKIVVLLKKREGQWFRRRHEFHLYYLDIGKVRALVEDLHARVAGSDVGPQWWEEMS